MGLTSKPVEVCQICSQNDLALILFLGYLPSVNQMSNVNTQLKEQTYYPTELFYCSNCHLVQLGLLINKEVLFPSEYPYTSSTTKVLRDNFSELYVECSKLIKIHEDSLIIDIGSNDGNLLSNFQNNHRVLGVTPEKIGKIAIDRGIPTIIDYFSENVMKKIKREQGKAKLITATNVFAHLDNINEITELIIDLLEEDGVFISESHYLLSLIHTLQYDTIYHEHMRYYSLHSLNYLFNKHGLEIFHVKEIPSHGGSIRVYCAKKGKYKKKETVQIQLAKEKDIVIGLDNFKKFQNKVLLSKLKLYSLLNRIKEDGGSICGIGAPSRGSTLVNYVGLDDGIINYICEIAGSHKINKYLPGTLIPIVEEKMIYDKQPQYALLLSWHIKDELIAKIRKNGFNGSFITPLPFPQIID